VGTTACQFLKINPSARNAGMAGVSAGMTDDVFALYGNPAALAGLHQHELAATFLRYFADINYGFVGYAAPVRDFGVLGFGYTYLMVGDMDKRDVNETDLGSFNAQDTSLTIAYGKENAAPSLLENLSLGGSLKVISSQIDQTVAYAAAVDLSAAYQPVEQVEATLALQNISAGIRFRDATDPLPLNLKFGVSYAASEKLSLGGEIDEYLVDNKFYAALGGEYWLVQQLALRAGYRFGYDTASLGSTAGLAAGIGFRIWNVGFDYAFVPFGDLGDTHRFSFTARF
jgi:long-subunit fatty acid transport protein